MAKDHEHNEEEHEDIIELTSGEKEILAYGFYSQLKLHKEHFSTMQNRYRALTSTWLLASFAGIGFLLSCYINLPFNVLIGVLILCLCGSFGITLIWVLDIVLYNKLWLMAVLELAKLEKEHSWLPKINTLTLAARNNKKYQTYQTYFYIGIITVFVLISTFIFIYYFDFNIWLAILIGFFGLGLLIFISYFMLKTSGELEHVNIDSYL